MNARTEPLGIIPGLSNDDYHAGPGVSNSVLSSMAKSPAHAYALHLAPNRPKREPTPAMLAGTLAHCAVLEPAELAARYACKPPGHDGRTAAGKAWAALIPRNVEIVDAAKLETAKSQRAAVLETPELCALFAVGEDEQSAYWIDEPTGLLCRCRPDWVHPLADGRVILVDLKTSADISPEGFAKSIWNFGYHRQVAWYSTGYERASGRQVAAFVFAAVSNDYPFMACAYMLDDAAAQRGASECRALLDRYAECLRTDVWPGYGAAGIQLLSLPAWVK
jgi:hypothetical protein